MATVLSRGVPVEIHKRIDREKHNREHRARKASIDQTEPAEDLLLSALVDLSSENLDEDLAKAIGNLLLGEGLTATDGRRFVPRYAKDDPMLMSTLADTRKSGFYHLRLPRRGVKCVNTRSGQVDIYNMATYVNDGNDSYTVRLTIDIDNLYTLAEEVMSQPTGHKHDQVIGEIRPVKTGR